MASNGSTGSSDSATATDASSNANAPAPTSIYAYATMELNFWPHPTLITERLILRELRDDDKYSMMELRGDEEIMKHITRPLLKTLPQVEELMNGFIQGVRNNQLINFAITLKEVEDESERDKLIGAVGFFNVKKEHRRAEVGYILHKKYQGKGIMKEALKALIDYAFNEVKLHALEAVVHPDNTASIKLAESVGFTRAAYFKDYLFNGKTYVDQTIYTIVNTSDS